MTCSLDSLLLSRVGRSYDRTIEKGTGRGFPVFYRCRLPAKGFLRKSSVYEEPLLRRRSIRLRWYSRRIESTSVCRAGCRHVAPERDHEQRVHALDLHHPPVIGRAPAPLLVRYHTEQCAVKTKDRKHLLCLKPHSRQQGDGLRG